MEVASRLPPSRSYTNPLSQMHSRAAPSPQMNQHAHQSVSSSTFSAYSDSTSATTSSTLFGAPPLPSQTPVNGGGPIEATNNVLNRRGDKEQSLFQICLNLRQRLMGLSEVAACLRQTEEEAGPDESDALNVLWNTFRKGYPLMAIYNALDPAAPLIIDENRVRQRAKAGTFKFLQACLKDLKFPQEECFIITDLYGSDTTGFVKVAKVVNRVLDILVSMGKLSPDLEQNVDPGTASAVKRTQKEHIISELVTTERTYVQHLELLHSFKKLVEEKGIVAGDIVHDIFLNLNALLDVQRRFLIRVEQINAQPDDQQNWGKLFVQSKDAFQVYEPYIANQKRCEEVAFREFEKLKETGGSPEMQQMVESPTHLSSFLLKPFQRLAKYPLLLKELHNKGDLDDARKADVAQGIEAASSVLAKTNAAVDLEERLEAIEELKSRVEDWKGHRLDKFGDLLLHGTFTVLNGDGGSNKDSEREYKIYLFETILLCCREITSSKQKNKIMNKTSVDKKAKPKLQLKGRIFMQNVTETVSLGKPGSYTCQIFWKGDPGIENFVIKFTTEDQMRKWVTQIEAQRRAWHESVRASGSSRQAGTSATEFTYMQGHTPIENPYHDHDEDDDDDETVVSGYPGSDYSGSRVGSTISARSRSTTGDSGPRVPPPRFPMNYSQAPLTLRTQQLQQQGMMTGSPDQRPGDSYFSPSLDSPMSSRTSSSSGMYPFPRQQTPSNGWYEDQSRYTAPAMGRTISREGSGGPIPHPAARARQPSHPIPQSQQNRMRSASSPDIQNNQSNRRMPNAQPPVPDVPVPPFPTHYAYNSLVNRSLTGSPNNPPQRAATQSPSAQRDRMPFQHSHPPPSSYEMSVDPRSVPRSSSVQHRAGNMGPPDRSMTPSGARNASPPMPPGPAADTPIPTQLKVKVHCPSAGSTMTLVVSTNISYNSLKDRIDAKLQRSTNVSLASGQVKLKYLDDDDFVSIQSDEDVQTAFETWKEQQRDQMLSGSLGEIELYCQ